MLASFSHFQFITTTQRLIKKSSFIVDVLLIRYNGMPSQRWRPYNESSKAVIDVSYK